MAYVTARRAQSISGSEMKLCWVCYKEGKDVYVSDTKGWTCETIQGKAFWECPECHEEPDDEDG